MANILYDPLLNPVKFHDLDPVQLPQYVSRFMDSWAFRRTIQPWDQRVCFYQPWLADDAIRLQYVSNFNPITLELRDVNGLLVHSQNAVTLQQDALRPSYYIRQLDLDLAPYDPGFYFLARVAAGGTKVSEPFEILDNENPNNELLENPNPTLYIEYVHYETYGGIKFQAPFFPNLRVPGILRYKAPGAKDTIYEDQLLNETMLNSVPFRVWELVIGGVGGVPPWFIDKVSRILGCSTVKIDGRLFTKNEGASFEPVELEGYPMAGWAIELRESLNSETVVSENDVEITGIVAAGLISDTKGFGMGDNSGNDYIEIISLQ